MAQSGFINKYLSIFNDSNKITMYDYVKWDIKHQGRISTGRLSVLRRSDGV